MREGSRHPSSPPSSDWASILGETLLSPRTDTCSRSSRPQPTPSSVVMTNLFAHPVQGARGGPRRCDAPRPPSTLAARFSSNCPRHHSARIRNPEEPHHVTASRTPSTDFASKKTRPRGRASCPLHLVRDGRDQFCERASRLGADAPDMRHGLDGGVDGDPLGHLSEKPGQRRLVEGPDPGASAPPEG